MSDLVARLIATLFVCAFGCYGLFMIGGSAWVCLAFTGKLREATVPIILGACIAGVSFWIAYQLAPFHLEVK